MGTDSVKDFSKLVDSVQLDRAFAGLPLTGRMRVEFNTKYVQNNEHDKNYYAVRYEHARRRFINIIEEIVADTMSNSKSAEKIVKAIEEYTQT